MTPEPVETDSTVRSALAAAVRTAASTTSDGLDAWTGTRSGVVDSLTAGLVLRLSQFEEALSRFSWPSEDSPWFNARLVIHDADLDSRVTTLLAPAGQAINPYKFFSSGRDALTASGVTAGDYAFRVIQGKTQESFSVTVSDTDRWGDVLGKVADAINASATLSVHADVLRQQQSFSLDAMLPDVGSILALSVNPLRQEQSVGLTDEKGDLLSQLDMRPASTATAPATVGTQMVSVSRLAAPTFIHSTGFDPNAKATVAAGLHTIALAVGAGKQPTTYVSTARDPDAATTLAPGTYTFNLATGGQSQALSVAVKAGWTWGDVMNAVSGQINAQPVSVWTAGKTATELVSSPSFALPGVEAASQTVQVPSATDPNASTTGRELIVRTQNTAAGQSLTLTDGSGGLLTTLGLTTPLRGQPVTVAVQAEATWGDVLASVAQSVALATGRVASAVQDVSIPATNVPGKMLSLDAQTATMTLRNRRLGEGLALIDSASGLLGSLGMDVEKPGQDGQITVNGQTMTSENNVYGLQQGRMTLVTTGDSSDPLPLTVTQSMDTIESGLGDVVASYNDVRKYLFQNKGFFTSGLAGQLATPVSENWDGLTSLGFSKTRKEGLLWIAGDTFWRSLSTDAAGARSTLTGVPSGLIPAWKATVAAIKAVGAASFLAPETANLDRVTPRRSEFDLERKSRLVDLLG